MAIQTTSEEEICTEQWYRYRWCIERGHYAFLEKAHKCDQFFAGNQWEQEDLDTLRAQRRPAMTLNKIISTVSSIQGEQIYNRNEVLFRPASGAKPETAEALSKVWMQISQDNQLPWVRSDIFADGIIRSRGFYDVRLNFDDQMQGRIDISQLNSKNVIIDPDAQEYDPDLWNDVIVTKWLTPQDIHILYSDEAGKHFETIAESSFPYAYDSIERVRDRFAGPALAGAYYGISDKTFVRRNVRVLERQYRKLDKQKHFVDVSTGDTRPIPDGWDRNKIASVMEKAQGQINVIKKQVKRIRWCVTADNYLLHDDWSPYKHFSVVPFFPQFRYGTTVGIVESLISPQEILNKVSSQELHVVNTTANSGWKVKAGSLRNMSIEELESAGAQTGLVLELADTSDAEKILPNQTPTGMDNISRKAEEHIKTISNVTDTMQGNDRADVAAKAIDYKTQRGSINLTKIMDNLERTDWILARNVLDIVQGYYTEPRLIDIIHEDVTRQPEQIGVNQEDPVTGDILNDLTLGEYNIVITSTPFRATMEDSQFEQAKGLREIGVKIPDSVLIENSRLNRKAEILKAMNDEADSPEAKAQAQLQQRHQEAETSKLEAEVQDKGADAQLKMARAKKEDKEASGEGDQAEIQKAAMQHQMDMERMTQEIQLKREMQEQEMAMRQQEMQQKMTMEMEQHQQEMSFKNQSAQQDMEIRKQEAEQTALHKRAEMAMQASKPASSSDA